MKIANWKKSKKKSKKNPQKNPEKTREKSTEKSGQKSTKKIHRKNPGEKSEPSQICVSNIHQQKIYEKYPVSNKYPAKYPCTYDRQDPDYPFSENSATILVKNQIQ